MEIFGFDAQKQLIPVRMNAKEIIQAGIHPWRIDLFDSSPVTMEIDGEQVFFTRMNNLSLAHFEQERGARTTKGGTIGQISNGQTLCVSGKGAIYSRPAGPGSHQYYHLVDIKIMPDGFQDLVLDFLRSHPQGPINHAREWQVCDGGHIYLKNGGIAYSSSSDWGLGALPRFGGEMFAKVCLRVALPPAVNAVFDLFKDWHPVVFGGALKDIVTGREFSNIDFMVDESQTHAIMTKLRAMGAECVRDFSRPVSNDESGQMRTPVFKFILEGDVHYHMFLRGSNLTDGFWQVNDFSVTQMCSHKPNEIIASRICLYDLAHKQTRIVSVLRKSNDNMGLRNEWQDRAQKLSNQGFRILKNEFWSDEHDSLDNDSLNGDA